jgi:hypothetical protein
MSFIDSIVDVGSTALKFFSGNPIAGALAKTAITSFALNQISKSINKDNNKDTTGNRLQLDPDTENAIPVVYGDAYVKPIITDAFMTDDNLVMWFCLTLCEQTGNLLSTGDASTITFQRVYWNDFQVNFQSDGITVASFSDDTGNTTTEPNGLIQIYPFSSGSGNPVNFSINSSGNTSDANTLMPNWGSTHTMDDLVFALVKITYNKEKNITALGNLTFKLNNTMTLPGDCLYDYMVNTRYGCAIPPGEIYQ